MFRTVVTPYDLQELKRNFGRTNFLPFRSEVPVLVKAAVHMSVLMLLIVLASRNLKMLQYYLTILNMCGHKILYFTEDSQQTYRATEAGYFEHIT